MEEGFGARTDFENEKKDDHKHVYGEKNDAKTGGVHDISNEIEPRSVVTSDLKTEEQKEEQPLIKQKTKRIATLDAFRGLTIVV